MNDKDALIQLIELRGEDDPLDLTDVNLFDVNWVIQKMRMCRGDYGD